MLSGGGGDVAVSLAGTVAVAAQGLAVTYVFAWMRNQDLLKRFLQWYALLNVLHYWRSSRSSCGVTCWLKLQL